MKKNICLIFDFDDTLAHTSHFYVNAKNEFIDLMCKTVRKNDLYSDVEDFNEKHLKRFNKLDAIRVKSFMMDKNRFLESFLCYYGICCGHFRLLWDCEVEKEIKRIASQIWNTPIIYPDTEQVLKSLKEQGYDLYCLTVGDPVMQRKKFDLLKEEGWDLVQYFTEICVVEMKNDKAYIDFKKSYPTYNQHIVIGDNLSWDSLTPLNNGFHSIWLQKENSHWNSCSNIQIPYDNPNLSIVKTLEEAQKIILEKYPII